MRKAHSNKLCSIRKTLPRVAKDQLGLAALEFAISMPVMLLLLGGLTDFSLAFWNKGMLASAVAAGAEYAAIVGPNVSASAIQSIVMQKLSLPTSDVTVTGPACYCVSGTPAAASNQACASSCPNNTVPGTYVVISAKYTYAPLLPYYSSLASVMLMETTMARLK